MAETTKIQWAHSTWSPWRGCQHAQLADGTSHPGCENCYAEAMSVRNPKTLGIWGSDGFRAIGAISYWNQPLRWEKEAVATGVRRRVFPSLMDPFEDRPELVPLRKRMFGIIDQCPHVDFILLTKRPGNIRRMWPLFGEQQTETHACPVCHGNGCEGCHDGETTYRKNVWLVTSVSDQKSADDLIPELLKCRDLSPVLGISAEPLLGPLTFRWAKWHALSQTEVTDELDGLRQLNWVIAGGESGPNSRPCHVEWIRSIVQQCKAGGVPCFVKQLGSTPLRRRDILLSDTDSLDDLVPQHSVATGKSLNDKKGGDPAEWPDDLRIQQFPEVRS